MIEFVRNPALCAVTALCLLFVASHRADAACSSEPEDIISYEIDRINDCLSDVSRKLRRRIKEKDVYFSERWLFHWGAKAKIDRMLSDPYFCEFEYERQSEFEAQIQAKLSKNLQFVERWYNYKMITGMTEIIPALTGTDDSHLMNSLSLEFTLKDFYKRVDNPESRFDDVKKDAAAYAKSSPSIHKSAAEGRLVAHNLLPKEGQSVRPSSIKTGLGVYFGVDPFRYGLTDGRTDGIVCDVPSQAKIVDLTDSKTIDALVAKKIYYIGNQLAGSLPAAQVVPQFENPSLTDRAAKGNYIFRTAIPAPANPQERVYVDKCAIDYKAACRRITLEAPLSCDFFKEFTGIDKIITNGDEFDYAPAPARPAGLWTPGPAQFEYFSKPKNFKDVFKARFLECYGEPWHSAYKPLLVKAGRGVIAGKL